MHYLLPITRFELYLLQVGDKLVGTIDHIMKVSSEKLKNAQKIDQASTRILKSLDVYSFTAGMDDQQSRRIVKPNVAVELWEITDSGEMTIGFGSNSIQGSLTSEGLNDYKNWQDVDYTKTDVTILLSEEVIKIAQASKGNIA